VRSPGFSSYRGYGNLLAERIHVHILGHAGQILRSYLHDLCDYGIQACYHGKHGLRIQFFLSRPLFDCFNARNPRVVDSASRKSLPMGVKGEFIIWCLPPMMKSMFYSCHGAYIFIFIGCATSAPNGSSLRGYRRIFYSSIGSKVFFFFQFFQYAYKK
jgi:hypothetical protein